MQLLDKETRQEIALPFMREALQKEALHTPFLFYGEDEPLLSKWAHIFASEVLLLTPTPTGKQKLTNGNHPDLIEIRPDPKSHTFVQTHLRETMQSLMLPPNEGKYKVVVLYEIEKMWTMHANALLKVLEEKPTHAVIVMTTTHLDAILPTITSRCLALSFTSPKGEVEDSGLKKLVHSLLESSLTPNYPQFFTDLAILERLLEEKSLFDELLTLYLKWFRDLEMLHHGMRGSELAFPEYRDSMLLLKPSQPIPFSTIIAHVQMAEDA